MKHTAAIALVLLGAACGEEEPAAADLLLPSVVPVEWEDAYNAEDDGLGALVPVDVMVYDGATGEPIDHVEVLVSSTDPGAVPIPTDGVLVVGGPLDPESGLVVDGEVVAVEDDPDLAWDAARDQYVVLQPTDAGERELALETDESGLARLYLYVDAFPADPLSERPRPFTDITVVVTVYDPEDPEALREGSFLLVPR